MTDPVHPAATTRPDSPPLVERPTTWMTVWLWIGGAALLRTLLSGLVPLLPDETYYWTWTRHLQGGYFDHPPGIALLITLGVRLVGDTHAGVRAGPAIAAVLAASFAALAAYHLSAASSPANGRRAAKRAAMLFVLLPVATLGLVLATPDAALFATVMLALLATERALASPIKSNSALAWWTLAGLALGAAFVAKYTAVLLPFALVVACLVHPALRQRFKEPGPWWASVIALALFSPVVVWNAANNWISFRFQLGHGFGNAARGTVLSRELELVGAQAGLASPILFALLAGAVYVSLRNGWRTRHHALPTDASARRFAFGLISLVPLLFFAVSATRRPVEANWPALMYPSAILLLATESAEWARGRWWRYGAGLAAVLLLIVSLQAWKPLLPLAPRKDPIARAHGWQSLADSVDRARHEAFFSKSGTLWFAADRYQEASELQFHLTGHPDVFSLNLGGRTNQYDLWPTAHDRVKPGDDMIAVFDDNEAGDSLGVRVGHWFNSMQRGAQVVLTREDGAIGHRRLWLYRNATSVPPGPGERSMLSAPR